MSTEPDETPDRRLGLGDAFQAAGLVLVTSGVAMVDLAAGFIAAGIACLWIGWSTS